MLKYTYYVPVHAARVSIKDDKVTSLSASDSLLNVG